MKLIFLTYINRSGSTFLANLLSGSEDVLVFPEADILVNSFLENPGKTINFNEKNIRKLKEILSDDPKLKYWKLSVDSLVHANESLAGFELFCRILDRYRIVHKPRASIMIFKAERIIHLLPVLKKSTSEVDVGFLGLIRDPRGTFLSQRDTVSPMTGTMFCTNPVTFSIQWRNFARLCEKYIRTNGLNIVQFEELIHEQKMILDRLYHALEMKHFIADPAMGDLYSRIPDDHKGIHTNITYAPIPEKIDEWEHKLSAKEILLIEKTTGNRMSKWGYHLKHSGNGSYFLRRSIIEMNYIITTSVRKFLFHIIPVRHAFSGK